MIVAFTGGARSGKNTAAQVLVDNFGYELKSFAEPVKEALYKLNPLIPIKVRMDNNPQYHRLQDVVTQMGWEEAKKWPEVRELLQRLGTDVCRNMFGENFWVDYAWEIWDLEYTPGKLRVISDARFDNEAIMVGQDFEIQTENKGIVVEIIRPGLEKVNNHASEAGIAKHWINYTLSNDSTEEAFKKKVLEWAKENL